MILYLKGLGNISVFEIALIFTILGAFLVFFGLYIMLRSHKTNSRKRKFAKKQLTMEQVLNDRLKQRRFERNLERAEEKGKDLDLDEKYTEKAQDGREEAEKGNAVFLSEIKKAQIEGENWESTKRYKNAVKMEIPQENRKISHRREQLKRLEEGTVLK